MNDELFLFDRLWFPKVFKIAREAGLDWIRMCAIIEVLSNGDPRTRNLDWGFINEFMGSESPVFGPMYYDNGEPSIDIIDKGTRWGLFQIIGQVAVDNGHTGQLVNLTVPENNIKVACYLLVKHINDIEAKLRKEFKPGEEPESIQKMAEKELGWPVDLIDEKVRELKAQMTNLLTFGD
jgi:hypothetical protein